MAIIKKVTKEKVVKEKKVTKSVSSDVSSGIIFNPRITEKAGVLSDAHVYTFDVDTRTNKVEVSKAFEAMYKVKPVKVRMITIHRKAVVKRGRVGMKSGGKKAMIYLKKGDKIEFI